MENKNNLNIGQDSVVIGNVRGNVGDGSVVIGAMDANGNVILNQPMAIGRNAKAGPGSIAIGANAGAGSDIFILLNNLELIINKTGDEKSVQAIKDLISELKNNSQNRDKVNTLWSLVNSASTLSGAVDLGQKIYSILHVSGLV